MCAFLATVAQDELMLSHIRVEMFVRAYVELLERSRMHTQAAYVRKHCTVESVRARTQLHTSISTACGRCKKPIEGSSFSQRGTRSYVLCRNCRQGGARCSIWCVAATSCGVGSLSSMQPSPYPRPHDLVSRVHAWRSSGLHAQVLSAATYAAHSLRTTRHTHLPTASRRRTHSSSHLAAHGRCAVTNKFHPFYCDHGKHYLHLLHGQ